MSVHGQGFEGYRAVYGLGMYFLLHVRRASTLNLAPLTFINPNNPNP